MTEAYGLNWVGKKAARAEAFRNIRAEFTLRPSIEDSVNFNTTHNLYIEGDNLTVMKLLQESYLDRIKMIYIDPPYNTGNDFIYRDNFTMDEDEYDEETELYDEDDNQNFRRNRVSNPRFHSDWCSMMYSRLICAKNLLARDGVIFISIDDHEVGNLMKICDEVFGERNFIGNFIWVKKRKGSHLSKTFRSMTEYVLCYAENIDKVELFGEAAYADKWQPLVKKTNSVKLLTFPGDLITTPLPDGIYKAGTYAQKTTPLNFLDDVNIRGGVIRNEIRVQAPFVWTQTKLNVEISLGTKFSLSNKFGFNVFRANQLDKVKRPSSIIDSGLNVGTNEDASEELVSIFGAARILDYPKPTSLIKYLVNTLGYYDKNMIVMDFFSGSATTAHAVMQLNAEDGGNRRFIMVQLPEECNEKSEAFKAGYRNICEIGKERIRRAGQKLKSESPLTTEHLDVGFRVLKLDTSNYRDVYHNSTEWLQLQRDGRLDEFAENIKPDRTALDLLFGCMIDWGFPLTLEYTEEHVDGYTLQYYGDIIACFDKNIPRRIFEYLAAKKPRRLLFRDESFADGVYKLNVMTYFKHYAPDIKIEII